VTAALNGATDDERFFQYLLRLGDDRLVLGHRLSQWCGRGPILEEDIALTNIALDLIGHANLLLQRAGEVEGKHRDQDALGFFREAVEYRNALIAELPPADFAFTIMRQFLFSVYSAHQWQALSSSSDANLAGIAAKAAKETRYHVRHAGDWVLRLGDGTDESHTRAQAALDAVWPYTGELFEADDVERVLTETGRAVSSAGLAAAWQADVTQVLSRATLKLPALGYQQTGGRRGRHTEHLGHMLAEMQIVARSYPGAKW
jgi:ring-1,2-phenylacetyl-CoA epoxidase subunit PaaC